MSVCERSPLTPSNLHLFFSRPSSFIAFLPPFPPLLFSSLVISVASRSVNNKKRKRDLASLVIITRAASLSFSCPSFSLIPSTSSSRIKMSYKLIDC